MAQSPPLPVNCLVVIIMEIPPEELEICLNVLQKISDSRGTIRRTDRFNGLVSKIYREGKRYDMQTERRQQRIEDRALQATTAMVQIQRDAVPAAAALPPASSVPFRILNQPETCYICKADYTEVHFFYHMLCPKCAAFNYQMRDLRPI